MPILHVLFLSTHPVTFYKTLQKEERRKVMLNTSCKLKTAS
jgi:hypothetical protein